MMYFYDSAKHIVSHFISFVFDAVKHIDIRRVISLQAQHRFFLCHLQVTVQLTSPFGFAPTPVN